MPNEKLVRRVKEIVAQHEAGEISDSLMLAQIASVSNRYGKSHGLTVNTQRPEVRMGVSRKTQHRHTLRV